MLETIDKTSVVIWIAPPSPSPANLYVEVLTLTTLERDFIWR